MPTNFAFPKSLSQSLRPGQMSIGSGWRAYFAPFNTTAAKAANSTTVGPSILDLNNQGPFFEGGLPPNWYDLGYIKDAKVSPGTKFASIKTGHRNVTRMKFIGDLSETLEIKFMERSRMVDSITSGMQVFNLLSNPTFANSATLTSPLGASGSTAVPVALSGYYPTGFTATLSAGLPTLTVPAGSGAAFPAGTYIVADDDFTPGTSGYVGDSAALVYPGAVNDIDYIRKTSDYVARVQTVIPGVSGGADGLVLSGPFVGGGNSVIAGKANFGPTSTAKVQIIKGYSRRNGGTKIMDWSCLLLLDTEDESQFALYYPHISPNALKGLSMDTITDATGLMEIGADTEFEAMAFDDPIDGDTVLSYLAYYPNAGQNIQI